MIARFNAWGVGARQSHPLLYAVGIVLVGAIVGTTVSLALGIGVPWFGLAVYVVVGASLQFWTIHRRARYGR